MRDQAEVPLGKAWLRGDHENGGIAITLKAAGDIGWFVRPKAPLRGAGARGAQSWNNSSNG